MIFVWAIESILVSLIGLGLTQYIDLNYFLFLGTSLLAGAALFGHIIVLAANIDAHHSIACAYLTSLVSLLTVMVNFTLDVNTTISLSFNVIQLFAALATVFASTKGVTTLVFHRPSFMLLLLGLFLRTNPPLLIAITVSAVLVVFSGINIIDNAPADIGNIIVSALAFVYVLFTNMPLLYIIYSAIILLVSILWGLQSLQRPTEDAPLAQVITMPKSEFMWPQLKRDDKKL